MRKSVTLGLMALVLMVVLAGRSFAQELTTQTCKEVATKAAALIEAEGEAAFAKIKDPDGEFRFADGAGYVWIQTVDGIMLMHPIKPSLDGRNLMQMQDDNGTYLFSAFGEIAEEHGSGWVPYVWPKPGATVSSPKVSFVVLASHNGVDYVAGCGMYDVTADDIKKEFPGDAVYES